MPDFRRILCSPTVFLVLGLLGVVIGSDNNIRARTGIVELFQWRYDDIARECTNFLGPRGFEAVQISPVIEHPQLNGRPWHERYQPVSYKISTRSGGMIDLRRMIQACRKAGVKVYVEVVLNNMATNLTASTKGSAGSVQNTHKKNYPSAGFTKKHFHTTCDVNDYNDAQNIRNCEVNGQHDLDQSQEYVRDRIVKLLNRLIDFGVSGFMIESATHMDPADLSVIYNRLNNVSGEQRRPYIYQSVRNDGAVNYLEYTSLGKVTESNYGRLLNDIISGRIDLDSNFEENWGLVPSEDSVVFVDDHETQREGIRLTHAQKKKYKMAVGFMLSRPYGDVKLMSSYIFQNPEDGPPSFNNETIVQAITDGAQGCSEHWVCEHRWRQIVHMVAFSNLVKGTPVTHFEKHGKNQVSFCRGTKGCVVFNFGNSDLKFEIQTSLPAGKYCDLVSGSLVDNTCTNKVIVVDDNGKANVQLEQSDYDGFMAISQDAKLHDGVLRTMLQEVAKKKRKTKKPKTKKPKTKKTKRPKTKKTKKPTTTTPTTTLEPTTLDLTTIEPTTDIFTIATSAEPTGATASAEPTGATASAEPTGATASAEPTGATASAEPTGATASAEPTGATASAEPTGATASAEPTGATASAEPTGATASAEPTGATASAEPTGATASAEPTGATASAEPTGATASAEPTGVTESTVATESVEPTGATASAEPTGATASAEPTGVTESTAATESVEPTGVTESTGATASAEPTGATASAEPTGVTESTGATESVEPTGATASAEPTGATASAEPTGATASAEPTGVTESTAATESVEPTGVTESTGATASAEPTEATASVEPTGVTESTGATKSVEPTGATASAEPTGATASAEPTGATASAEPTSVTESTAATESVEPTGVTESTEATASAEPVTAATGSVEPTGATESTGSAEPTGVTESTSATGSGEPTETTESTQEPTTQGTTVTTESTTTPTTTPTTEAPVTTESTTAPTTAATTEAPVTTPSPTPAPGPFDWIVKIVEKIYDDVRNAFCRLFGLQCSA